MGHFIVLESWPRFLHEFNDMIRGTKGEDRGGEIAWTKKDQRDNH